MAKRGDQCTYDSEQVAEAATIALVSDFRKEVTWSMINALKSIFGGLDNSLRIPEIAIKQLEDLRNETAGSVFARNAVEWSIQLVNEGRLEPDAVFVAIGLAAKARGFACARQIHEHVLRATNKSRADGMTSRVTNAIGGLSESSLGSLLMNREGAAQRRIKSNNNLDAGVPL